MSRAFECLTRVWRARLYQLWRTRLTFIRFKVVSITKEPQCVWSLQAGISRILPFGSAPFSLDRWTLIMPQGVCRMDAHWSQCALRVCVCVHIYGLLPGRTRAAPRQSWGTWLCAGVKCYWAAVSQRQNELSWNVSPWPWGQIHCCIMGQKTLEEGKQTDGKKGRFFVISVSLSFFFSFSQKDKGLKRCYIHYIHPDNG